ncbi:hypothetical protein QEH56_01525 [Pelagicoccus enzymogenes]|uniref:hypothetical protein n=1 Tax=Pelagicoccus enzymogenes TaxID=2773457 RepID=UPI00280FF9C9|nr:hypothetical protein [Pelagicoccus enzymogenes]MDQ8196804.1 hypothetical protein [Pelagicoccus enzymogenes]
MNGIPFVCIATVSLFASCYAVAAEIPVVFTIVESERTSSIRYSTGDTSEQTFQHTGSMEATLSFDPATQSPTAIRFTGGLISESPTTFKNTATMYLHGLGIKKVVFEQSTTGLQMRVNTIGAAHPISPEGKILENDRLESFPIAGILTTKLTIDGRTQTQEINVATNPPDRTEGPVGTDLSLQVFEESRNGRTSNYRIAFITVVDTRRSEFMPNTDTAVTRTLNGSSLAEATFNAPSPFGQWLLENGYELQHDGTQNAAGIPLALLFAFNLPADYRGALPWKAELENGKPMLTLQLPASGLKQAIQIESCSELGSGIWEKVHPSAFVNGQSDLSTGAMGQRRILFTDTYCLFYRITTAENNL